MEADSSTTSSADDRSRYNPLNLLSFIRQRTKEHVHNLTLTEISGSLGDLGTFIPLTVALARERKIALAPSLFWAGISNVVTGYAWDVPMCVQPMKSIAAVALTDVAAGSNDGLDAQSVTTAGILTGAAVLLLGVTNLIEVVNWIVPLTVVCGIQFGVGLRLAAKGIVDVQELSWGGGYDCIGLAVGCSVMSMFWLRDNEKGNRSDAKKREDERDKQQLGNTTCDGLMTCNDSTNSSENGDSSSNVELGCVNQTYQLDSAEAVRPSSTLSEASLPSSSEHNQSTSSKSFIQHIWNQTCCCLHLHPKTPHPVGIYLFLIGSLFAAVTLATAGDDSEYDLPLHFFGAPVVINALKDVTPLNWRQGFLQGTLPQLPLTTLNSVISVCCLAHNLYPEKRQSALGPQRTDAVVTRKEVSVSVGLMNLLLCPLGSMPNCHGAGGLAGQHRFGARYGTSVVVLGLLKVFLAVFFGGSALTLLDALPVAVLGVMLVIAGLELVGTGVWMLFECVEKEADKEREQLDDLGDNSTAVNKKAILQKNTLVAMVTAAVIVALKKTHYGAIAGWIVHMIYGNGFVSVSVWFGRRRTSRETR